MDKNGKLDTFSSKLVTTWSSIKLSVFDHAVCFGKGQCVSQQTPENNGVL
jgi:hypothetical protein